jgi:hypothetical protein
LRSWPVGYSKTDTMGAGWACALDKEIIQAGTVHAYALCQVPHGTSATAGATGAKQGGAPVKK